MKSLRDFIAAFRHTRRHGNTVLESLLYAYGYAEGWRKIRVLRQHEKP